MESRLDIALRLRPDIVKYINRLSGNKEDAEDATQEAYAKVWYKLDGLNIGCNEEEIKRFMYVVARNTYIDIVRKRQRRPQVSILNEEHDHNHPRRLPPQLVDYETPEDIALESERNERIDAIFSAGIAALNEPCLDLIQAVVRGETPIEYARRNGHNPGTISFRSWSARQRIKEALAVSPFAGD